MTGSAVCNLRFTEEMRGYMASGTADPRLGFQSGQRVGDSLMVRLEIEVADVDRFLRDVEHVASARGSVTWEAVGGRRTVDQGIFNLFPLDGDAPGTKMRYCLWFRDDQDHPLTLLGIKIVRDDPGVDLWEDTTTLFTWIIAGSVEAADEPAPEDQVLGAGIIRISMTGFLRQLGSFQVEGGNVVARAEARARFGRFFAGELWTHYGNPFWTEAESGSMSAPPRPRSTPRPVPVGRELRTTTVPFVAGDGVRLNLVHVEGERPATRGPVLLVHGAGSRADIFRPPVTTTLVDLLVADGYDVWLENWRASIDVKPSQWDLDQAAVHDHPQAVHTVLEHARTDELKAIVHCQGSVSFVMSATAGLLPEVTTIVSNAVALHPVIPAFSRVKIHLIRPIIARLTRYMDPHWGVEAPDAVAKMLVLLARLTHHECDNTVCKLVSFTYGYGFPALWSHENLNEETHEWVKREFAKCPLSFFAQMARCVARGSVVPVAGYQELPASFVAQEPRTEARFVFLAGMRNRCFLPQSQERSYRFFDDCRPGYHALRLLPGYGHLDVFMGYRAAWDVFPMILDELARPTR